MRMLRAGAGVALLVPVTACGEPFVAPTTREECQQASPGFEGEADVSSGLLLAYSEEDHPLGSPGTLYVCLPRVGAATLSTEAPDGVEVDPDKLVLTGGSDVVPELEVTVEVGDEERLAVAYDGDAMGATVFVVIEVDGDEWSFREP
jgi:hypothetical protein